MAKYIAIVLVLFASGAQAADQSSGCGLGWSLFQKNSLVSSYSRSITNALASNTSAMTSGTSGCAKHDFVLKEKEAMYFAEGNYQKLKTEFAEGKGEHMETLARILGCNASAAKAIGPVLQKDYETIFPTDHVQPSQMLNSVSNSVFNSNLASQCMTGA